MSPSILISGANGFIAVWVVKRFLEKGYKVIGTVRSESKGKYLKEKLFPKYIESKQLELVVVDDITKPGAFDKYLDVDYVAHTASPFHFDSKEPDDVVVPAVQGTKGILESVNKVGSKVKRVVVTSSVAAISTPPPAGVKTITLTEANWNDTAVEGIKKPGPSPMVMYQASKTLAERAAWETQKGQKWELVTVNPTYVFGPPIHECDKVESLNTSTYQWYRTLCTKEADGLSGEDFHTKGSNWVDVRDLADAHVLALEKDVAGKRFIIAAPGNTAWQRWLDAANSINPNPYPTAKGTPGAGKDFVPPNVLDVSQSQNVLGVKYTSLEDCTKDTFTEFQKRGW